MAEKKLAQKKLKIQHTVDSITRIELFLSAYKDNQQSELKPRLERLENLFETFEELSSEYESLDDSIVGDSLDRRAAVEEQYLRIKGGLVTKLQREATGQPQVQGGATQQQPTIELPKFDGNLSEWITFHDSFNAIIHTSLDISPVQKLQYLRSALKGDALRCIESLPISAANYNIAWDTLLTRYQNKVLLKKRHLHALTSSTKSTGRSASLGPCVEDFHRNVKILEQLGEPVDDWDTILIHLLSLKVDGRTLRDWEEDQPQDPSYQQFIDFLNKKIRIQEALTLNTDRVVHKQPHSGSKIMAHAATEKKIPNCIVCNESHPITKCNAFENMSIKDRLTLVQSKRLCSNCLYKDHFARNCQSKYSCRTCNKRHHTWLHPGSEHPPANETTKSPPAGISQETQPGTSNSQSTTTLTANAATRSINVFLSTAVIIIVDKFGKEYLARALLDSASQANLMSRKLQQLLKIDQQKANIELSGVDGSVTRINHTATKHIRSRVTNMSIPVQFLIVNKVTNSLPAITISTNHWNIPPDVRLADPEFQISKEVDLILGAEHYYNFIKAGRIQLESNLPTLIESEFGWLVSGKAETTYQTFNIVCHANTLDTLETQMERFWNSEEIGNHQYSVEERHCEDFFTTTTARDDTGRYIVQLPKKPDFASKVGNSKASALRRFEHLERRLDRDQQMKEDYHKFMKEYLSLGHMRLIEDTDNASHTVRDENTRIVLQVGNAYYLPHHPVIKETSTTTKIRVVFDGSAQTSTGFSLNVGPVVQDDLFSIILRFRTYPVALVGDIEKMYRQVLVHPDDYPLQRILFRFSKDTPVQTYELQTVTYGLSPSPFLATRTLQQLASDEGDTYNLGGPALRKSFYVDDFIGGATSIEEAIQLREELSELLQKGGFTLRKWTSNRLEVLQGLEDDQIGTQSSLQFTPNESIKALGIGWEPEADQLRFGPQMIQQTEQFTKRRILSDIAKLFDPLGLIAPVVVKAKILMQQIWILSLDWDEVVPSTIANQWKIISQQLPSLADMRIERYAFLQQSTVEWHCFVDASSLAYGACLYVRSENVKEVKVRLLTSKSKVAPLKRISIPRLELCAALLGARLYEKISQSLDMKPTKVVFWSDSTVVLHWLKASPHTWKTFVANRVSEIQALTHNAKWLHISGLENPADLVSRGLLPEDMIQNKHWFEGPNWLSHRNSCWPVHEQPHDLPADADLEVKTTAIVQANMVSKEENDCITRFSSYGRMINVIGYCLRFINNCRSKKNKPNTIVLSIEERNKAVSTLVKGVQLTVFSEEYKQLSKGRTIGKQSNLKLLNPFIDQEGIIRVGGRLNQSREDYSIKHPIITPGFHHFTKLLLTHYHWKLFHGGTSVVLATVRAEFWPINGRRAIRSVIRNCYNCVRANPQPMKQPVGQLPTPRTITTRPFFNTGVDYCGPVYIKSGQRKVTLIKAYIAIFVCFTTKAVHIELVGNLSTDAFISALKRFIARKGLPRHIYSDNGTNFIGAKNELHAVYQMLNSKDQERINSYLATEEISWHLIPPRAPNFGGLWEAAVKVAKKHLVRQIGSTSLFFEDLITLLTQIEACMNSRPLTPLTEDSTDYEALTPGHFLIGASLHALPELDVRNISTNRLNQYQLIQQKVQHFWDRWRTEYLRELHRQAIINPACAFPRIGQMVILQDHLLPPCRWPLVRIEALHPGPDGICRVVTLRTASGSFRRPISKICAIPSTEENGSEGTKD